MNTVRILICATFALLVAALVHTYSTKGGSDSKSLSQLKNEYHQLKLQNDLDREKNAATPVKLNQYNDPFATTVTTSPTRPVPPADFVNPLADNTSGPVPPKLTTDAIAKIDALEIENAKLKAQQEAQESENDMLHQEAGAIQNELLAQSQPEEARATEISQALVMARVKIYDTKSGITVLDLVRPQNLTTGQVLGIRRGSAGGIIGRIKLGNIESNELGYADPILESFFGGPVDIQVGDEIIVIP